MDAIEPEPRLVHNVRAERVCFADREDLPLPSTSVSKAGNGLSALGCRLRPAVPLIRIVAVQGIIRRQPVIDVERVLIVSNRSNGRTAKCTGAGVGHWY